MNKSKGITPILILVGLGILLAVGVGVYIFANSQYPSMSSTYNGLPQATGLLSSTPLPVSDQDDTKTLQIELNNTTSGAIEPDINALNSEASSL